jgi:nucleoside-diphosphate-sugar epimerase
MIMITGGMGFLGSSIAKILCEQDEKILLAVHKQTTLAPFLECYQGGELLMAPLDITDLEEVEKTIRKYNIGSIIHAASIYEAKGTLYDAMRVNVVGTINILEASVRNGISRISALSSEAVYQGIKQVEPLMEAQPLHVESDRYIPGTKRAEENLALLYAAKHDLDVVLVRASRIYGPLFMGTRSPINIMLQAAINEKACELNHIDEAEGHDNIYVKDCARGVVMIHKARQLKHHIYNLGTGKLTTFGEIRDAIKRVFPKANIALGKNLGDITSTKSPLDINACLDMTRINKELGFKTEYDIDKGIRANITWLTEQKYI